MGDLTIFTVWITRLISEFSFDYGITDNLQVGVGRSKYNELIDASVKYKILSQKEKKVPLSIAAYANSAITPEQDVNGRYKDWQNRLSYVLQVIFCTEVL